MHAVLILASMEPQLLESSGTELPLLEIDDEMETRHSEGLRRFLSSEREKDEFEDGLPVPLSEEEERICAMATD